jgi:hypothetical protein
VAAFGGRGWEANAARMKHVPQMLDPDAFGVALEDAAEDALSYSNTYRVQYPVTGVKFKYCKRYI